LQLGNAKGIVKTFGKLGMMTNETDRSSLLRDVEYLIAKYYDIPMKQIKLGAVIKEVFDIAYEHELQLPNEISILGKTIITIEKIISGLDPTFSKIGRASCREGLNYRAGNMVVEDKKIRD